MIESLNDIRPGDTIIKTRHKDKKIYVCIDTNLNGDDEFYSNIIVVEKEELDKYLSENGRCIVDKDCFETLTRIEQFERKYFDLLDEKYRIFKAYVIEKESVENDKAGTD